MNIVEMTNVTRTYTVGDHDQKALDNVTLSLEDGKMIVILGPSGAGKSTLLNLLGGLDNPTSGKIVVDGRDISSLNSNEMAEYRAAKVGFVFQSYNLIPTLTVMENIELINEICPDHLNAQEMLQEVGLGDHMKKFPHELSGGEQQRVSIARALTKNPRILLCDEPTGALDSATGVLILKLLQKMSRERKKTVILVTHNQNIALMADQVIHVKNGKISSVITNTTPASADDIDW